MYLSAEEHLRAAWLRGDAPTVTALEQAEAEKQDALDELRTELEAQIEAAKAEALELAEQLRAMRESGPAVQARRLAEVAAREREEHLAGIYGRALHVAAEAALSQAAKGVRGRQELAFELRGLSRARGDELLTYLTSRLAQVMAPPARLAA